MYGAGNPQMAALGALGALGGSLRDLAMSPVQNWGQASLSHKVVAAGVGTGLAYYLHKQGMADITVAASGIAGAYVASMLMHYRQTMGAQMANGQVAGALPEAQVQEMTAQANAVMNGSGNLANGQWAALGPSVNTAAPPSGGQSAAIGAPASPAQNANSGVGSSKWAALG